MALPNIMVDDIFRNVVSQLHMSQSEFLDQVAMMPVEICKIGSVFYCMLCQLSKLFCII